MKKVVLCLSLLLIFPNFCLAEPVKVGERICYKIVKLGLKAGEATLTFAGPRFYHRSQTELIIFEAKAFNFFDEERIYVDPKSFKPLYVERNLNIFGNKEKITEETIV